MYGLIILNITEKMNVIADIGLRFVNNFLVAMKNIIHEEC